MSNKDKYNPQYNSEDTRESRIARLATEYDGSYSLYDCRGNLDFKIERTNISYFKGGKHIERYAPPALYFNPRVPYGNNKFSYYSRSSIRQKIQEVNELQESYWNLTVRIKHISTERLLVFVTNSRGFGEFMIRHNLSGKEIREHKVVPNSFDLFFPKWDGLNIRIEYVKGSLL